MQKIILVIDPSRMPLLESIRDFLHQKRDVYAIQLVTISTPSTMTSSAWEKTTPDQNIWEDIDQVWAIIPADSQTVHPFIKVLLSEAIHQMPCAPLVFTGMHELIENQPVNLALMEQQTNLGAVNLQSGLSDHILIYQEPVNTGHANIKTIIASLHSHLVKFIHPIRLAVIPQGSSREEAYYRIRLFLRKAFYYLPENMWRLSSLKDIIYWNLVSPQMTLVTDTYLQRSGRTPGFRRRSMIMPGWWSKLKSPYVYDQLDAYWEKHKDRQEHVIYITSSSPQQSPNSHSARIGQAIQNQGASLIHVYYRFSSRDSQKEGETNEGFQLPLDRLWAHPDRIFYTPHAPRTGKRRILIDFPHPSLFRVLSMARQMGWSILYEPTDDWALLQKRGLARWYCPWFEYFLALNADYDSSLNPIWEEKDSTSTIRKLEKVISTHRQGKGSIQETILPEWWNHLTKDETAFTELADFVINQQATPGCVVIFSGVLFTKSEGQRATWLTRAFNQMGIPVIFTYFRFGGQDKATQDPNFPMVYQFPIDQLWAFPEQFLNTIRPLQGQKLFLMEFPHPALIRLIHLFQCHGWSTVYEIIDDWREFKKVGQADWYFDHVDAYIHHASQHISATSEALVEHAEVMSGRKVHLIQNAFEAGSLPISSTPRDLPRGRITIGYFGHLTSSWFDWDLLVGVARRHPEWIFHVIGYGYDAKLTLPDNILLLGKIAHDDLPHFAANWDVAMIPFKTSRLSRGVNPIKVYEYLELHLPVVTCGMPHLSQMPFVHNVESMEEFEKQILQAAETQPDQQIISAFLEKNTWTYRAECLLNLSETVEVTK